VLVSTPAWAQGGGASQTGTISGRVADASGAVLPGVTVTATSPALIGSQTAVTNESGIYRFPALPSGVYTLTFELSGFSMLRREGIEISIGFTATINVELQMSSLQESVTVSGESPVIDTSATRVQQNFKKEQLESIPNARDMWSLLAVAPGVVMGRVDVGGNRAGTQTGYTAYGYSGQVRVLVEGINTTEGTGGAGFYFDYGSFDEVFLGTAGQGAEMPHPGVQSQFVGKSGGNAFQGSVYYDYENNSLQGSNISDETLTRWAIRPHSNEIQKYHDFNIDAGGPIKKDKVWWYGSYRSQFNAVEQPNFLFNATFDTKLWNPSGKVTYQLNQNNKFIGYYQWGQKIQPNRLPFSTYTYTRPDDTWRQDSGSWVWKGEWNGTVSNNLYLEARYGDFGYYFPLYAYDEGTYYRRDTGALTLFGGDDRWQTDRDRKQLTAAATLFRDRFLGGSHNIRFGGEVLLETQWEGYLQSAAGHIEHRFINGVADRVVLDFPTATEVNSYSARNGGLLTINKLDQEDLFLSDQWTMGRVALNLGVRWDRYKSWVPDQHQMAFEVLPGCAGRTDITCAVGDTTFPEQAFFVWNSVVPRVGIVYDLRGNGRTVLKANYGLYRHNPGPGLAGSANPNQAEKTITYSWTDLNNDGHFQIGEQGTLLSTALAGTITLDPDLKQPSTQEVSAFVEHELMRDLGVRGGYVFKTNEDLIYTTSGGYQNLRPISAYTTPFSFLDIGPDGVRNTSDDEVRQFFGVPNSQLANFPVDRVIMNVPQYGRYHSAELSINKRHSQRWSANAGFVYTWLHDYPNNYPNTPNDPSDETYTRWSLKLSGTYDAPWDLHISPVLRHQAGAAFARTLSVNANQAINPSTRAAQSCGCTFSGTVYAEPYNAERQDNIWVFDIRAEKAVNLAGSMRARLFVDVFNLFNQYAAETIGVATGSSFLRPTAILAPRVARFGVRFQW
jgi:hypothetical protein